MSDHGYEGPEDDQDHEDGERERDLVVKDGNGEILFELKDVGILSVDGSEGSLTVHVGSDEGQRSVFKTG